MIRPQLEAQVLAHHDRRQNRDRQKGYEKRHHDIEKYYNQLRSPNQKRVLPTIHEFRKLPIIQLLQNDETAADDFSRRLKHISIEKLIKAHLDKWEVEMRERRTCGRKRGLATPRQVPFVC